MAARNRHHISTQITDRHNTSYLYILACFNSLPVVPNKGTLSYMIIYFHATCETFVGNCMDVPQIRLFLRNAKQCNETH